MKDGRIIYRYDKRQKDFVVEWGNGIYKGDVNYISNRMNGKLPLYDILTYKDYGDINWESFTEELEKRGYDIKTLKFSIDKKHPNSCNTEPK